MVALVEAHLLHSVLMLLTHLMKPAQIAPGAFLVLRRLAGLLGSGVQGGGDPVTLYVSIRLLERSTHCNKHDTVLQVLPQSITVALDCRL